VLKVQQYRFELSFFDLTLHLQSMGPVFPMRYGDVPSPLRRRYGEQMLDKACTDKELSLDDACPTSGWNSSQQRPVPPLEGPPNPIRAKLVGCTAMACGKTAIGGSPVLDLCRELVAAGHNPQTPLEAYRGETLCLTVRSIGEAAGLEINGKGTGFRLRRSG
jgi:hypothetical protein